MGLVDCQGERWSGIHQFGASGDAAADHVGPGLRARFPTPRHTVCLIWREHVVVEDRADTGAAPELMGAAGWIRDSWSKGMPALTRQEVNGAIGWVECYDRDPDGITEGDLSRFDQKARADVGGGIRRP